MRTHLSMIRSTPASKNPHAVYPMGMTMSSYQRDPFGVQIACLPASPPY